MIKKLTLLLTLILTAAFGNITPASALESGDVVMSVTPSNQELELTPGQTFHGEVTVSNTGRLAFDFTAKLSPYYVKDDSYDPDFEATGDRTLLSNWTTLDETKYHVEPGEKAAVEFTIKVPEDVPSGGQYAAIMLHNNGASTDGSSSGSAINVSGQIAAILYGHVNGGELRQEATMTEHSFPRLVLGGPFAVSQTIENTGNVDFRVSQTLTITNFFSNREVVSKDSISSDGEVIGTNVYSVLPGTTRTGITTWRDAPKLGLFNVTWTISFLDQDYTFRHLVFICPIWLAVIVIVLLLALIIWLIFAIRKRYGLKKAQKIN